MAYTPQIYYPQSSYAPQFQQPIPQPQPQPQYIANNSGINWVSGESGAKSWMVGKGETVLLMDSENQCFYIKTADASGMPLPLRVFDYSERMQNIAQSSQTAFNPANDEFVTRSEFDALRAKYEEIEKQIKRPSSAKKEVKADE